MISEFQFKYAPEKWLNGQSEVFYFTANENSGDWWQTKNTSLQFFPKVAQNSLRIPRVFHVQRNPWVFQVFQVCGHPVQKRQRSVKRWRHYVEAVTWKQRQWGEWPKASHLLPRPQILSVWQPARPHHSEVQLPDLHNNSCQCHQHLTQHHYHLHLSPATDTPPTNVGQHLLVNIRVTHDNISGQQLNMAEMADSADDDVAAAVICLSEWVEFNAPPDTQYVI